MKLSSFLSPSFVDSLAINLTDILFWIMSGNEVSPSIEQHSRESNELKASSDSALNSIMKSYLVRAVAFLLIVMLGIVINQSIDKEEDIFMEQRLSFAYVKSSNSTIIENDLTLEKLTRVRKLINVTKEFIWNTWDVSNFPLFLKTMHVPTK